MDKLRLLSQIIFVTLSIGIALIMPANARSANTRLLFSSTAHRIVASLDTGDFKTVVKAASSHGILVVRRYVDWKQSNVQEKASFVKDVPGAYLSLSGLEPLVWVEHEVRFEKAELNGPDFLSILKQFQDLVRNTENGYSRTIVASLNTHDAWKSRHLGPAVQGKIASNSYWYVYFVREHESWKIWKLEFVTH